MLGTYLCCQDRKTHLRYVNVVLYQELSRRYYETCQKIGPNREVAAKTLGSFLTDACSFSGRPSVCTQLQCLNVAFGRPGPRNARLLLF